MSVKLCGVGGLVLRGSGVAFPETPELENADVYASLLGEGYRELLTERGWSEEHPREAWGVERRRWSAARATDASQELAVRAARCALEDAGLESSSIDLLVLATSTPGRITSSLAAAVGERLGLRAACLDLRAGGTGGLQAWALASTLLAAGPRRALVIAAETPSQYLDPEDLASALLYGDGAAALVIERGEGHSSAMVGALLGTEPAGGRPFTVPGDLPPRAQDVEAGAFRFQGPDAEYRRELSDGWRRTCEGLREAFPRELESTRHFLPYAVTRAQVERAAAAVGIDAAHSKASLAAHGCTGCAGPLIALHELRALGALASGDFVASVAVAGGLCCCSILWRV